MSDPPDEASRRSHLLRRLARHAAVATSLWRSGIPATPTTHGVHLGPEAAERLAHHLVAHPVRPPTEGAPPWPAKPSSPSSAT